MRAERPIQRAPTEYGGADQLDLYEQSRPLEPFRMHHEAGDIEAHENQADGEALNTVR